MKPMKPIETMGGRETNHLYLSDCFAAEEDVLGEVDQGWVQLMAGLISLKKLVCSTMSNISSGV